MITETELAHVLRQSPPSGLYQLPQSGADVIAKAARRIGFALLACDLAECDNKADFLARVAVALHFPDWFGHNWDALADCLTDLSWLPAGGYVVLLENADRFRVAAEADFITALEIFEQAARDRTGEDVPMWVFVGLTADGIAHLRSLW